MLIAYTNIDMATTATPTSIGPTDTSAYVISVNAPTTTSSTNGDIFPLDELSTAWPSFVQCGPRCCVGPSEGESDGPLWYDDPYRPPTRLVSIEIFPAEKRTLSDPMAECYWARGPPKELV